MPYIDAEKFLDRMTKAEIEEDYRRETTLVPIKTQECKQLRPLDDLKCEIKEAKSMRGKSRDYNGAIDRITAKNLRFTMNDVFNELKIQEKLRTTVNFQYYMKGIKEAAKKKGYSVTTCDQYGYYTFLPVSNTSSEQNDLVSSTDGRKAPSEVVKIINIEGKTEEIRLEGEPSPKVDRLEVEDILIKIKDNPKLIDTFNLVLEPLGWKAVQKLDLVKI